MILSLIVLFHSSILLFIGVSLHLLHPPNQTAHPRFENSSNVKDRCSELSVASVQDSSVAFEAKYRRASRCQRDHGESDIAQSRPELEYNQEGFTFSRLGRCLRLLAASRSTALLPGIVVAGCSIRWQRQAAQAGCAHPHLQGKSGDLVLAAAVVVLDLGQIPSPKPRVLSMLDSIARSISSSLYRKAGLSQLRTKRN